MFLIKERRWWKKENWRLTNSAEIITGYCRVRIEEAPSTSEWNEARKCESKKLDPMWQPSPWNSEMDFDKERQIKYLHQKEYSWHVGSIGRYIWEAISLKKITSNLTICEYGDERRRQRCKPHQVQYPIGSFDAVTISFDYKVDYSCYPLCHTVGMKR